MRSGRSARRALGFRQAGHRALAVAPVLVLGALLGGSLAAVADLTAPPTPVALGALDPPSVPVLSLRRDLDPLADQAARRRLRQALDLFVAGQPADTCLSVDAGDVRYEHRVDDPQVPASTHKLLTGVAALMALGPDFRHVTRVVAPVPPAGGVVPGDLHVVGSGDPLLALGEYANRYDPPEVFSDVRSLADALVAAGITRVDGAIVGDETRYDATRYHPAWPPRFTTQDQTGPLSALTVNDGFVEWPPRGDRPVEPAADPAALGAEVLRVLLEERGVTVGGGARSGPAPQGALVVAEHAGLPLRDVVGQMLRESDNATGELLLKELGLQLEGSGTFEAGARAVARLLAEAGFDVARTAVVDGSGLADGNRLDCALLVDVLGHDATRDALRDGMPVAGQTGTLADRWLDTPVAGRVRAKTGTLNQVTGLAGYVDAPGGEITFALVANVSEPERIRLEVIGAQQSLVEVLAAHPDRPDVSALEP
ncbi:MAG TPA: D-alanyl-D-alanine carboxypeptidase/D-alanyl-D-alanine-endopeptidase [Acidimicrobiales bacterium]|nr:D-alanyl-D-alanine carboxypeptidase/D-alanyl-D-alanine-endopeptidase [Acidimicrobiales bacterium]